MTPIVLRFIPDPKNAAEREANHRAAEDYQRQEEEAADFLGWEAELAQ